MDALTRGIPKNVALVALLITACLPLLSLHVPPRICQRGKERNVLVELPWFGRVLYPGSRRW
jgi:hypothetical protein